MSAPQFLFDEDFDATIIRGIVLRIGLARLTSVHDQGLDSDPDPAILEWAAERGYIVVTHDRQTMPLFAYQRVEQHSTMPGVVVVPQRMGIGPAIEDLLLILGASEAEEWRDQVIFLPLR